MDCEPVAGLVTMLHRFEHQCLEAPYPPAPTEIKFRGRISGNGPSLPANVSNCSIPRIILLVPLDVDGLLNDCHRIQ